MPRVVDASVWIDFTRARSPQYLKDFIAPYILDPEACLAEPVVFEVLRYANEKETLISDLLDDTIYDSGRCVSTVFGRIGIWLRNGRISSAGSGLLNR